MCSNEKKSKGSNSTLTEEQCVDLAELLIKMNIQKKDRLEILTAIETPEELQSLLNKLASKDYQMTPQEVNKAVTDTIEEIMIRNNPRKPFVEVCDVRDGLFSSMRSALIILQKLNSEKGGCFVKSVKVAAHIAEQHNAFIEEVYDSLIDVTYPRCQFPLVDGLGNMYFPPADMDYSEMRTSEYYQIAREEVPEDPSVPLLMSLPNVLSNGTVWGENCITKIPSHNIGELLDAMIALINNPNLETKDLLAYVKGPDVLVGGVLVNQEELCEIYEKGQGFFKIKVTPDTINDCIDDPTDYCGWYGFDWEASDGIDVITFSIPYYAFLCDGEKTRLMSLKEILQSYIAYFRSHRKSWTNNEYCDRLQDLKKVSKSRRTKI